MTQQATRGASRELSQMIWQLLQEAGIELRDIDRWAVDVGPGSFTGLRLGLATVRALAWSQNKPVISISSIGALIAQGRDCSPQGPILVVLPARQGVVYTGFSLDGVLSQDRVLAVPEIPQWLEVHTAPGEWTVVGPAEVVETFEIALNNRGIRWRRPPMPATPQAHWLIHLAAAAVDPMPDALAAVPHYLMASEAEVHQGVIVIAEALPADRR